MIMLTELAVTQNGFRNEPQIDKMIAFVAEGGYFHHQALNDYSGGKDTRLISIARFENGRMFIHDGHHRAAAIYLGGRKFLSDTELQITDWKYSDYTDINFENRWITPFDPRNEVRICNYESYKQDVWRMYETFGPNETIRMIKKWKERYVLPRRSLLIQDLLGK